MNNHFDNVANNWDKNLIHIQRTDAIAKKLLKEIDRETKVKALEFGAGTGLLSFALKDYFSEITLMDNSSEMIRETNQKITNSEITHLHPVFFDLESGDYNQDTFDFIFSQMALHHVGDIEKIISRFYNLLNAGGKLAIADLCKEDGTFHDKSLKVHPGFDPDDLAGIISMHGFHDVKFEECFVIERPVENGDVKKFPVFLMTGNK